jgi:hypothetical protein
MGYLEYVDIPNNVKDTLHNIRIIDTENLRKGIIKYVSSNCKNNKQIWKSCTRDCYKICHKEAQKEISSTSFILKCLAESMIPEKGLTFDFDERNISKLTGIWNDDKKYFKIVQNSLDKNKDTRLILGFGPSASGKTYWSKTLIELFSKNKEFPKKFLSIDGGIYRECSKVYQIIRKTANELCYAGFNNLHTAGLKLISKSIFPSSKIKKYIIDYIKTQEKISLYIPETLGGCGIISSCKELYKKYIDFTGDKNYIALMIFQHKSGKKCPYKGDYTCVGCIESGTSRQIREGKKYSSTAYDRSILNGNEQLKFAPYRYVIHNNGRITGKSILFDLNDNNEFTDILINNAKSHNYIYNIGI